MTGVTPGAKPRTATAIRFNGDLHQRLVAAADERDLSVNWLVNRAVAEFLDRLLPLDEIILTRPHRAPDPGVAGEPESEETTRG